MNEENSQNEVHVAEPTGPLGKIKGFFSQSTGRLGMLGKYLPLLVIGVLAISVSLAVFLSQQSQDNRQQAAQKKNNSNRKSSRYAGKKKPKKKRDISTRKSKKNNGKRKQKMKNAPKKKKNGNNRNNVKNNRKNKKQRGVGTNKSATQRAETTPPTVAIISHVEGTILEATPSRVTIAAHAHDASGIARVEFLVDQTVICSSTKETPPYTCPWTVPSQAGRYALRVNAYDNNGNVGSSPIVNVTRR